MNVICKKYSAALSFCCMKDLIKTVQLQKIWPTHDVVQLIAIISFICGALFYISGGIVG